MRTKISAKSRKANIFNSFVKNKALYAMLLPGLVMMLLFNYLPMFGMVLAFSMAFWAQQPVSSVILRSL